jgi:hypothetical protein
MNVEEREQVSRKRAKRVQKAIMVNEYGWGGKKDCGERARMKACTGL